MCRGSAKSATTRGIAAHGHHVLTPRRYVGARRKVERRPASPFEVKMRGCGGAGGSVCRVGEAGSQAHQSQPEGAGLWRVSGEDLTLVFGRVITGKTPLTAIERKTFGGQDSIRHPTRQWTEGRPSANDQHATFSSFTVSTISEIGGGNQLEAQRFPRVSLMVSCMAADMGKAVIAGRDASPISKN